MYVRKCVVAYSSKLNLLCKSSLLLAERPFSIFELISFQLFVQKASNFYNLQKFHINNLNEEKENIFLHVTSFKRTSHVF